jgi:hypothetical protein
MATQRLESQEVCTKPTRNGQKQNKLYNAKDNTTTQKGKKKYLFLFNIFFLLFKNYNTPSTPVPTSLLILPNHPTTTNPLPV